MNKKDLIQQNKLTPTFYGVIQIKNNQTGQTFIDAVPNIHNRWGHYQANLNNHFYHDTALQADWDRLGADAFSYSVLWKKDTTDVINLRHKLKDLKQEWLEKSQPAYNQN